MAELDGLPELTKALDFKKKNVKKDISKIVDNQTKRMFRRADQDAHFGRYKLKNPKKKSTGYLKRHIKMEITNGGLTGVTGTTAEYGGYVEMGTRYMRAQPFIRPGFDEISKDFIEELEKLTK